jgi:hypothetical protein
LLEAGQELAARLRRGRELAQPLLLDEGVEEGLVVERGAEQLAALGVGERVRGVAAAESPGVAGHGSSSPATKA